MLLHALGSLDDSLSTSRQSNSSLSDNRRSNDRQVKGRQLEALVQQYSDCGRFDWDHFMQLAMHHRVFPLLHTNLKLMSADAWLPQTVQHQLQVLYRRNTFQMLLLSAEMEMICRACDEHNIQTLLLKGPVLATDLYGDVSLRTSGDIDLLVPLEQLKASERLLISLGYEKDDYIESVLGDWKWRHHHMTFFHPDKQMKVEVHWRLNPGPAKNPRFAELWEERRQSHLSSYPLHMLGEAHLFMFLVTHGARHGWSRLRWLVDVAQLVKRPLDWSRVINICKKYQVSHIGGQSLVLIDRLLQPHVAGPSEAIVRDRRATPLAREAMFYIRQMINLHHLPQPTEIDAYHKRHLFKLMSKRQKFWYLLSFMYPYAEDAHTLPLPKLLHGLYFVLRPVLWLWRKTKKLAFS